MWSTSGKHTGTNTVHLYIQLLSGKSALNMALHTTCMLMINSYTWPLNHPMQGPNGCLQICSNLMMTKPNLCLAPSTSWGRQNQLQPELLLVIPRCYLLTMFTTWGFLMDNTLKNQFHINKLTCSTFNQMMNIRRICSKLDRDTTQTIIQALVMPKLDYCNSLLLGLADYQLNKIQRIQNMACRIVCNLHIFDHVTPTMQDLHWLKIPKRIQFKIACLKYKCINGQAPKYLTHLLPRKQKTQQLCSSTSTNHISIHPAEVNISIQCLIPSSSSEAMEQHT